MHLYQITDAALVQKDHMRLSRPIITLTLSQVLNCSGKAENPCEFAISHQPFLAAPPKILQRRRIKVTQPISNPSARDTSAFKEF